MIDKHIPDIIKQAARDLRNNMTVAEVILWKAIKSDIIGYRFLRQRPIYVYTEDSWLDRFVIADFYCDQKKLVIELDWSIHNVPEVLEWDKHKELLLTQKWIQVLRFTNNQVRSNISQVVQKIKTHLS